MTILWRLMLAALLLVPVPVLAHKGEKHGETAEQTAPSGAAAALSQNPGATANRMVAEPATPSPSESEEDEENGSLLTKLHPATVHFPIALFLMAALTELFTLRRSGGSAIATAVRIMVYGGAAGAVVAVVFGWIHTGIWFGGGSTMQWHRWTGTGLAVFGLLVAYLAPKTDGSRTAFRAALFAIAFIVPFQGYWGAELAHGPDHLGM